jgi:cellulose synthase/poly-beta-1,6-N-acetylglucosamine synthase-like glycosyltransferase
MTLAVVSVSALLAIWLGYPLVVAALAAVRRERPRGVDGALPTVTVIVATRDDAATVGRRVENALAGDYPPDRLSVVVALDAAGALATPAQLAALGPRVRVVVGDAPGGKAAALNAGVRAATGEVLVMADTAQTFSIGAIRALVEALGVPRMGAVSGQLEIVAHGRRRSLGDYYWLLERWLRRNEGRVHSTIGVTGAIYATRARLWTPLPEGLILDDLYVPMRLVLAGHRVGFTAAASAADARVVAASQEYRRKARTLTGVLQLCAWLPGVLNPLRNPVWMQFVFHKLLRLLTPYLVLATLLGLTLAAAEYFGRTFFVAVGAAVLAGALVALARPAFGRRVRDLLVWGVAMQGAIVVATVNGVRGRWDVWHRPS